MTARQKFILWALAILGVLGVVGYLASDQFVQLATALFGSTA